MKSFRHGFLSSVAAFAMGATGATAPGTASAGPDAFLGDILAVGETYCPRGWAPADGQLLPISAYTALFSLLGTTYGGDGRTTFGLPDLRGRRAMGEGRGPGLTPRQQGQKFGSMSHTVTVNEMPSHRHTVRANNLDGDRPGPGGKLLAAAPTGGTGNETIYSEQPATRTMAPEMITHTGGSQPLSIQDPYLVVRYCIATEGVFPSRS